MRACVCACVRVRVCTCVRACVHVCVVHTRVNKRFVLQWAFLFNFFFSVNRTEFVVPRTLPFTVPANVTGGYGCNDFAHAVQSKVINLVVNQTPYEFNKLCQATSRHISTPVAVVNIPDKNLAVAKSDIILAVEPIADSGYDTSGTNLVRSDLPVDEDGHEEVHQCTKDAYDNKICGEDESTVLVSESTITPTDTPVNPKAGLPINNGSSSSQLAKVGLSSSTPRLPSGAVHWHDEIPDAEESLDSSTSSKMHVAETFASPPLLTVSPKKNKRRRLPSHPPHRERSQVSPSSTGKPPPLAGEWEEPQQETPWELDTEIADPIPQIETMVPVIKPFTALAGKDVSRSCSKWFSDAEKREASMSSAPSRFVSYPQSPRRTLAFHDCEDSGYGSVSTM